MNLSGKIAINLCLVLILSAFSAGPASAQTKVANDPTRIGVGARILGMGKTYVGLADDLSGIFINPAALADVDQLQLTSMQGQFINEFNYLNLGAAVPTRFGQFGIGYVGSNIGFTAPAATTEVVDGVRIIPSTTEGVSYSFLDSVLLLSWGNELKQFVPWEFARDLSAGATLKIFSLDLSGPGVTQGKAGGMEVDLGMTYRPTSILKLGLVAQNVLPFSAGGKIKWDNGTEETLPSLLKPGLSLKVLGEPGLINLGGHELSFNLDLDWAPLRPELPELWHAGVEWWPARSLALRAGVDQDYVGGLGTGLDPVNNLTAGVGLLIGQFRFDYAFHQYNQITDNDTHYFSLSYGVGKAPLPAAGPALAILPRDKTIVFTTEVTVKGTVLNPALVKRLLVNSAEVQVARDAFESELSLGQGKNTITVQGYKDNKLVETVPLRLLSLQKFRDVEDDHWAAVPISLLAMEQVISGYPDGTFRPDGRITRAEFTKLLMAVKGSGDFQPRGKPYRDIRVDHWAAPFIGFGARFGFVKGYPDNTFRPNNPVTRAEGVAMFSRFAKLPDKGTQVVPFSDVPGRFWAAQDIIKAYEAGILSYLTGKEFQPNRPLTRGEVAEMLAKTPPLKERINVWLDWEEGY